MPDNIFFVLELQTDTSGAIITWTYNTLAEAESKFYAILSAAALSNVRKHGAIILNDEGIMLKHEVFTHRLTEEN